MSEGGDDRVGRDDGVVRDLGAVFDDGELSLCEEENNVLGEMR